MPLQDLPCLSLQGSMLSQSENNNKRKSKGCLSEGLDVECTPTELIQQWSPSHKHQRLICKGKENDSNRFVLARRSRRKKESTTSGLSWDHLPDELLLRILCYIPLQDLLRMTVVCKRWHRLARLQLVRVDLSSSIIPTSSLERIICECRLLEYLSLEGLQLSDTILSALSKNPNLLQLNLSGCSGFSGPALADMLKSLVSIEQLNISWCEFNNNHVKSVVNNLSPTATHLNLSGYRENLLLDDVKVLVTRCPYIQTLDLSDLGKTFPTLRLLDVFGIVNGSHLSSLKKELPLVGINTLPFSSTARPTPAARPADRSMWNTRCRLRVRLSAPHLHVQPAVR
ncbi:hypothetical protein FQN60_008472 [Etheostoma spectabile]|uniref:F-box domain-containing protein n=1 Tax=Etheostoma spectabile TaxID=54343 RepID=A0A5J5CSG0_9PERO|nr:hypothetical protein FQN60_008472 [Etheostoma spectabile]